MSIPVKIKPVHSGADATADAKARNHAWRLAMLLAIAAACCGVLLTGISVWFLGAVALTGLGPLALSFNFHTPAAFVRLFAVGKTACKYGERIAGHRAALLDQVQRRTHLFAVMALAPATRVMSWQFGNQDRLSDYMDDVEDVDYARLRVGMPAVVLAVGAAAMLAATACVAPLALPPIAALWLIAILLGQAMLLRISDRWATTRTSQRQAGQMLGSALAALVPLKAERAFARVADASFARFNDATAAQLAQRHDLAALDMATGLIGPLTAIVVLAAAWRNGDRDEALLVAALVAFSWLALGETMGGISRMLVGHVRERVANKALQEWREPLTVAAPLPEVGAVNKLELVNVSRQTPDSRRLGPALNLTIEAGHPVALLAPSGAGKTTLLKQIAGWIGTDEDGQFMANGALVRAHERRAISHLILHDAAILSDTVRENLFAPGASDAECWEALAAVELDGRIAAAGGLGSWITQDMLSLGEAQRLNLARALLGTAPIVLLDEPVEHLDSRQAVRLLDRVLSRLSDRVVIYSSHNRQTAMFSGRILFQDFCNLTPAVDDYGAAKRSARGTP